MILTDYLLQKLNKPGLWFVCSEHPASELIKYVYDFAVELGVPVVVYSDIPQKEIQNSVIDLIKAKYIGNAENESERDWLEQEMMEYNTHGFFCYPEELNDYVPNGSFWTNYVFFDEFKILSFTNSFSKIYLIENLSDLWYNNECDIFQSLHSYAFHNLFSHLDFSIYDLLWVRDFNIEIHLAYDYNTYENKEYGDDLDWEKCDYWD